MLSKMINDNFATVIMEKLIVRKLPTVKSVTKTSIADSGCMVSSVSVTRVNTNHRIEILKVNRAAGIWTKLFQEYRMKIPIL